MGRWTRGSKFTRIAILNTWNGTQLNGAQILMPNGGESFSPGQSGVELQIDFFKQLPGRTFTIDFEMSDLTIKTLVLTGLPET
ncbi:MAG: hypothetical protein ACI9BD_001280 [Candidatus Marinamargulisbacteria bacterium]